MHCKLLPMTRPIYYFQKPHPEDDSPLFFTFDPPIGLLDPDDDDGRSSKLMGGRKSVV